MKNLEAGAPLEGARLDKGLSVLTGASLRCSRRMINDGLILLNNRKTLSSCRLKSGDRITVLDGESPAGPMPRFLERQGAYYCFYKPAGMHSVILAGRPNQSLEAFLPQMCAVNHLPSGLTLLQRLDFGTSGIICATSADSATYRGWEAACVCRKHYLALLSGRLEKRVCIRTRLAAKGGRRMRPLPEDAEERCWTSIEPLWHDEAGNTLGHCVILAGQRHQIRCHAALAGHPLAGDELYGGGTGNFALEHYLLEFPGHRFFYLDGNSRLGALAAKLPPQRLGALSCI